MGIDLPPEEVRRHARDVDEVANMLDEARSAATHIRASNSAYGFLVGPLFTHLYLNPHADDVIASFRHAVDGLQSLADMLRSMADSFEHGDAWAAARIRSTQ
jgi:hypothetical protein